MYYYNIVPSFTCGDDRYACDRAALDMPYFLADMHKLKAASVKKNLSIYRYEYKNIYEYQFKS